jgi:hypothetical protein
LQGTNTLAYFALPSGRKKGLLFNRHHAASIVVELVDFRGVVAVVDDAVAVVLVADSESCLNAAPAGGRARAEGAPLTFSLCPIFYKVRNLGNFILPK